MLDLRRPQNATELTVKLQHQAKKQTKKNESWCIIEMSMCFFSLRSKLVFLFFLTQQRPFRIYKNVYGSYSKEQKKISKKK